MNRHTKNLLSEIKILSTGKLKTGPSMNLQTGAVRKRGVTKDSERE